MLCSLFYMVSLGLLAGVATQDFDGSTDPESGSGSGEQDFSEPTVLDISSCPITFYGRTFEQLYVSFTEDNFVICFRDFYNPATSDDCIIGAPYEDSYGEIEIRFDQTHDNSIKAALSEIQKPSECYIVLTVEDDVIYRLHNYGPQAVLYFEGLINDPTGSAEFRVLANESTIQSETFTSSSSVSRYFDISGCRYNDIVHFPNTEFSVPDSCLDLLCNETSELVSTAECGPMERCLGNSRCVFDRICTVSGPVLIDFSGEVDNLLDRCGYTLLSLPSEPDFQVLANFRERHRTDVSFLDSVTLRLGGPDIDIHLRPDGKVWVNNTMVSVGASGVQIHGVDLTKDRKGIMAKMMLTDYTAFVFFDGDTTEVRLEGPYGEELTVEGLCGNASQFTDSKVMDVSSPGCDTVYEDPANVTADCDLMTERCNMLKKLPFSNCNNYIDPEPYITACTQTLCNYPAVDRLSCQFLEAYARACSLHTNVNIEPWRDVVSCSAPEAFCDRVCLEEEFCGLTLTGKKGCLCRAIFAAPYKMEDRFAEPTVCQDGSASVTLIGCFLEERGINYTSLHLNDQTCKGDMDEQTHRVTFGFDDQESCGTVVTTNSTHVIYKNHVKMFNNSDDVISRNGKVEIEFSCVTEKPDDSSLTFRIHDSSVIQQIKSGVWEYNLTMEAYTDASHTQVVHSDTEISLNQKIWVMLKTQGLNGDLISLVTDSCWATSEPSADSSMRYDLITNGCANPNDGTVTVEGNGLEMSNQFSFNMFQFSGSNNDVYLHCRLNLCVKSSNNCVPSCGSTRRRRSVMSDHDEDKSAFISMMWTN